MLFRSKQKDGTKVDATEWHNIACWNGLADVVGKYVKKGTLLYVEGKINTSTWDDEAGNKRHKTEIHCINLTILDSKSKDNEQDLPY